MGRAREERVKRQGGGAGIGLRLSEALGRAFGLDWDDKLLKKLERLNWKPKMLKRYVDDLNTVVIDMLTIKEFKLSSRINTSCPLTEIFLTYL